MRLSDTPSSKQLLFLSIPLIFSLLSTSLMGIFDRIFLSQVSLDAIQGCVSASYLASLFQLPLVKLTSMAQVFIGRFYGSEQKERIGSCVWQMIWLSFLSMVVTVPIGLFAMNHFFEGTAISITGPSYFKCFIFFNFLLPINAALTSFYVGIGRTRFIFITILISHIANIVLDYVLIFGIPGFISPMGVFGAAIASIIAQIIQNLLLLLRFLSPERRMNYKTHLFKPNWQELGEYFRIGFPRALARVIILTAWAGMVRILNLKNGDYLLVLSLGSFLILCFSFIFDGLSQALISQIAHCMGSKKYASVWQWVKSAFFVFSFVMVLISIPFLIFPEIAISFFASKVTSPDSLLVLKRSCIGLWAYALCYGFNSIGLSIITAAKDTKFYLIMISFVWLTSFLPTFLAFEIFNWSADKLWLITAADSLIFGVIFFFRAMKENWKMEEAKETTLERI